MSLKEIAHRAGTSVSTVSRVLNQPDYKCKNPELEARIWAAAQEISYTPNTAAQTLKSGAPQNHSPHFRYFSDPFSLTFSGFIFQRTF